MKWTQAWSEAYYVTEVESDEINEEQEEAVVTDAPGPEVTSERSNWHILICWNDW